MNGTKTMRNFPKVTVVTVTYNAEKYLENTIKSVIEQDYPHVEYIIIDGASTDGTLDIIKKYEKHIDYWISEPDSGIYDAMNKGIDVATGEWINFMNAGDSFCESTTIMSVFTAKEENTDLIGGDIYYYNDNKDLIYKKAGGLENVFQGGFSFCCHQALFVKKNILKVYPFSIQFKITADYDFMLKAYFAGYKYQFIDEVIAIYLNGGTSKQNPILSKIEELFILSKNLEDIKQLYSTKPFNRLINYSNKNFLFTKLFNDFQCSIQKLNLNDKNFILYGFGNIGQYIYSLYQNNIIAVIDKEHKNLTKQHPEVKIGGLESIKEVINFDFIFISVLGREEGISTFLMNDLNIDKSKILCLSL